MTVEELIEKLKEFPQDVNVSMLAEYWNPVGQVSYNEEDNEVLLEP